MNNKPTIEDVAKLAGVSIATVSRVINNLGGVREETKKKIKNAIEELNYIPNQVARSMVKKKTKTIGVIIPDIRNPFFPLLVSGIEQSAREKGYFTMLSNTNESVDIEIETLKIFQERGVDGLIVTTADENGKHLKEIIESGIPIVAVDRQIKQFEIDTVLVGNYDGAYQATRHLIYQGHKEIAIICGPLNTTPGLERFNGYKRALQDYNLEINSKWILQGDFRESSGYELTKKLFKTSDHIPTAIFSSNNLMTLGCIKAIQDMGLCIGKDISLVGFDDIEVATFINPKLTVISRPMEKLGEVAFELLYERMSNKTFLNKRQYVLSPELVIRGSCKLY